MHLWLWGLGKSSLVIRRRSLDGRDEPVVWTTQDGNRNQVLLAKECYKLGYSLTL